MIRLGLRLTLNGGREAAVRLVIIALAVALGVGMLLITLAGINGVNAQNARYAWLETSNASNVPSDTADPAWWLLTADQFRGDVIGRVDVAATGPTAPVPPGIAKLPGPGQFYASPSMTTLLDTTPRDELGVRFPGTQIGTIGAAALPSPNSLVIVIGRTVSQLSHVPGAHQVTSIATTTPSSCSGDCYFIGIDASGIDLVLSVSAAALLFPVLIFIGTASRLSAATREQRFAAMRLVGATPRQISVVSAVESSVAAAIGIALGFGLFFLVRPPLAKIPFTGAPFFLDDLSLNLPDVLVVAVGVPVAAAVAARIALRRVTISPLGVTRRVTPRPPGAWRILPLLAGLLELLYFASSGRPETTPGQIQAFTSGILVVMAGLVIAGPWLTMLGARLTARRTGKPAVLIAARRLADNPKAGFRAISGLVLALFVTSVAIGIIATIHFYDGGPVDGPGAQSTLFTQFNGDAPGSTAIPSVATKLLTELPAIPGVHSVTLVHTDPSSDGERFLPGVVSCADLARTPALGRCPSGADTATADPFFGGRESTRATTVWPASAVASNVLAAQPVQSMAVSTDGSTRAVELARTAIEHTYPYAYLPETIAEQSAQNPSTNRDAQYQRLVDVILIASLPIAGCSLAVSVAAGLTDRKRPFSLLRLAGAPLGVLRRVVALESVVPMLVIAAVSIAVGFLTAGLFLNAQLSESLQPPGASYYVIVVVGLVASLAVIASTLPLLERITGPETARND
jgi:hypothetical protein